MAHSSHGAADMETCLSPSSAIKADTYGQYGVFSWMCVVRGVLFKRKFRPVVSLRLCQMFANERRPKSLALPFFKLLHRSATGRAGMDLPWQTRIGAGLAITHGWGSVINPGARIGNNGTLFHGVTLGRRDRIDPYGERSTQYPALEDDVWVEPHAIVVGDVAIGRGSSIAGGAFLIESVPPFSVVSGNPARIVKTGCTADVMLRAPL